MEKIYLKSLLILCMVFCRKFFKVLTLLTVQNKSSIIHIILCIKFIIQNWYFKLKLKFLFYDEIFGLSSV